VIAYAVEAFVFGYLGITFFSFIHLDWSWQLFLGMLVICIVGRFIGTIGIIKIFELFGYKSGIPLKDLIFISYAGIIRGAVAFGLVLRIDEEVKHRSVIVTTSLALVCFTTIFLGSTVATLQRLLFGKPKEIHEEGENYDPNKSHHEEFKAYNEVEGKEEENDVSPLADSTNSKKMTNKQILRNFDKTVVKPFLIYEYEEKSHRNQPKNEVLGAETGRKSQIG
jgi:NhaP-type Na+/H+ or K+/H+ antiporter